MRIPVKWRTGIKEGRLLILSIFEPKHKRLSAPLAEKRNRFVADICTTLFIPHASPKSKTEQLAHDQITNGKTIYTLDLHSNEHLKQAGIVAVNRNHKWDWGTI
jgi:predicted Rossmann fold nucleotide-binding protein DprA/Smf involved in DNA uptake